VEQGVRGDRWTCRLIGEAREGVDYQFAAPVHSDLQPALGSGIDQVANGFLNLLLNVNHGAYVLCGGCGGWCGIRCRLARICLRQWAYGCLDRASRSA
jgi:hypothetical protein